MSIKQNSASKTIAEEVFSTEITVLQEVMASLDESFDKATELMLAVKGRVVVTGMGKSGHIGAKIAATLASTGTPAFFVHPAEMGHGDLGMLTADDLVLALSFSGNTEELRKVLTPIRKLGVPLISITGSNTSTLAEFSDVVLYTPVAKEACPLDLAPTSSTTAGLVMGDALAIALMKHKNIQKQDFARSHPLGSLGRSFIQVSEIMRDKSLPQLNVEAALKDVLEEINSKALGFVIIVGISGQVLGVITDGDLRRAQLKFGAEIFDKKASDLMNTEPKIITQDTYAIKAADIMKEYRISNLIIVDDESKPIGVLDLKDLLAQGFVI